ncbi:MAG TPA: hypothetical protein VFU37_00050 [Pyrinomonadaceae bacterium]|nr:hypothetical protein [Pyrinomonadaceae bacterium]
MSEREFDTDEIPVIELGTNNSQPLTTVEMAGVAAAAARRMPISDQIDVDRERGAVDYQSTVDSQPAAVDSQPEEAPAPLFEQSALQDFRSRWGAIQTGFVDNPGGAVKLADELVAAVMKRLAEVFADERANLEQKWAERNDVSTEDLRVAIRRYRSFFDRLLSV